jgi:hypothetical protein
MYFFTPAHLSQDRLLPIISAQRNTYYQTEIQSHPPTTIRMSIIKKRINKFLLRCAEKAMLYVDICNINKCHHYGSQYGDSLRNKTKNSGT